MKRDTLPLTPDLARAALEEHGVVLVGEDDGGGSGVRRRYNAAKIRRLQRWEAEGGQAYEDDIQGSVSAGAVSPVQQQVQHG